MKINEIKREAKNIMKGHLFDLWLPFIMIFLINIPFTMMVGLIAEKGSILELVLSIVTSLLLLPMSFGTYRYYLNFVRKEKYSIKDLFKYFGSLGTYLVVMIAMLIAISVGSALLIVPGIMLSLAYFAVPYLCIEDRNMSPFAYLKESRKLMKGHKMNLFLFNLSFIGWILGIMLTCGILTIYVYPYMITAQTIYYDELKKIQLTNK